MSSRASRPRSRRRLVGVSAVAVGALLTTYAGGLRNFSYVRADPMSAQSGCSGNATQVATDDSLQEAITNSADGAVICVTENITVSQTLVLDDTSVTLEGDDSSVQLSGGGTTRILFADFRDGSDDTLILRNLTLTQGTSLNADDSDGGAVLVRGNSRADTFIGEDITVTDSYSFEDGGGIALASMEYARLSGARFYDDSAASDSGAFEINYANSVVIDNSVFKRNTAINNSGGAFEFQDVLDVRVYSSTFSDNESSSDGGSVRVFNGSDFLLVKDSTFEDDSTGGDGGSLALVDIADVRFDAITVKNGQAATFGGAAYLKDDTYVQVVNSTFTGNSSPNDGGGVYIDGSDDTVAVRNSGFYGNSTTGGGSGGGLYISDQDGPVVLESVTAHDNTAASSGGFLRVFDLTSTLTITDMDSQRNYASADGGSIKQTSGDLFVYQSSFTDDSSADGGAIFSSNAGIFRAEDSDFISNQASGDAGAVRVLDGGSAYITSSVFRLNKVTTDDGGAILINNVDDTVALTSVTLDQNSTGAEGGGVKIVNSDGVVIFDDITATGNAAGTDGGAIYVNDPVSTTITNSRFSGNFAGDYGGAIHLNNNDGVDDTQILSSLTFTDDSAAKSGGSVWAWVEGPLTMSDITASGSNAVDEGGFAYLTSDDSSVTQAKFLIENSTFSDHRATGGSGRAGAIKVRDAYQLAVDGVSVSDSRAVTEAGGLYIESVHTTSLRHSTFARNVAGTRTGGVAVYNVGDSVSIEASTFVGNESTQGAAGFYLDLDANSGLIRNTTVTGNKAVGGAQPRGGGVYVGGDPGSSVLLDFVTVSGNTAYDGGGLFLYRFVAGTVTNSIVSGNQSTDPGLDVLVDVIATLDDSFSLFTSADAVSGATIDGPGSIFGAPRLNGLADNGGPTLTMLPQWDSPAFAAGDPNWTAPPVNDHRGAGFPRDAGGRVSMGAIQGRSAKPAPPPAVPATPPRDVQATAGDAEILVSWTPPASTGTFPVTAYQVDDSTGVNSCLLNVAPGDPLSCVIEDLINGTAYSFRVRALTGAGWGAWSDFTVDVTPEPGPSIMITGTRDRRSVSVDGVTTGLVGETMIPRVRFPGPKPYEDGVSRPVVDEAGDFTWQRRTRKKVYVYFFTEDRELRSNRVIIRPRR